MASGFVATLSSGLSSAILVMVSTLSLKGGRPVRAALRAARASYPLTLRNFFKKTGVVKNKLAPEGLVFGAPRVQEKTAAPSKRRAGATSEDWADFFWIWPPKGGVLSGRCPAVRPRGRTTCPATCPAAVRPRVRPRLGHFSLFGGAASPACGPDLALVAPAY